MIYDKVRIVVSDGLAKVHPLAFYELIDVLGRNGKTVKESLKIMQDKLHKDIPHNEKFGKNIVLLSWFMCFVQDLNESLFPDISLSIVETDEQILYRFTERDSAKTNNDNNQTKV